MSRLVGESCLSEDVCPPEFPEGPDCVLLVPSGRPEPPLSVWLLKSDPTTGVLDSDAVPELSPPFGWVLGRPVSEEMPPSDMLANVGVEMVPSEDWPTAMDVVAAPSGEVAVPWKGGDNMEPPREDAVSPPPLPEETSPLKELNEVVKVN